jgi:hypothetical protein
VRVPILPSVGTKPAARAGISGNDLGWTSVSLNSGRCPLRTSKMREYLHQLEPQLRVSCATGRFLPSAPAGDTKPNSLFPFPSAEGTQKASALALRNGHTRGTFYLYVRFLFSYPSRAPGKKAPFFVGRTPNGGAYRRLGLGRRQAILTVGGNE